LTKKEVKKKAKKIKNGRIPELAKRQFEDYPKVQRRAKKAIRISIAAIIVQVLIAAGVLLIKWKCNMQG